MVIERGDVILVRLDPTVGSEIRKTRPCLVLSPDEMNRYISTIIVAPMSSKGQDYPTRVSTQFKGKIGQVALDQIRTVDKSRVVKKLGKMDSKTIEQVKSIIQEMLVD